MSPKLSYSAATILMALAMAAVLWMMGREPICTCGYVKFWHSAVYDAGNSQHLLDWYTLSHIIHGFLFYAGVWLFSRLLGVKLSLFASFIIAGLLEGGWEILENSQLIIDRYREANAAMGYNGDTILNSVSDFFAMVLGFWFAHRWPVALTAVVAVGMELLAGYVIRDNLFFNVQALLFPSKAIADWQTELHAPQKLFESHDGVDNPTPNP